MKNLTKFILAVAVASSLSTSTLFAQEGRGPVTQTGTTSAMSMGWAGWAVVGIAIGGIVAVATTANNSSSTGHNK